MKRVLGEVGIRVASRRRPGADLFQKHRMPFCLQFPNGGVVEDIMVERVHKGMLENRSGTLFDDIGNFIPNIRVISTSGPIVSSTYQFNVAKAYLVDALPDPLFRIEVDRI